MQECVVVLQVEDNCLLIKEGGCFEECWCTKLTSSLLDFVRSPG